MNARASRFPLLDSLRAIAALCIFATHAYFLLLFSEAEALRPYAARLDVGVAIFFAISGFLLYRPFVRARLDDARTPAAGAYLWRRLLRIGPAYWVALTVVALGLQLSIVFTVPDGLQIYAFGQVYEPYVAIGGLVQAWSLCVEAAFYLFLPLYALALRSLPLRSRRARLRAELAGVGLLVAVGFGFSAFALGTNAHTDFTKLPLHLWMPGYLHQFAIGIGLAVLSVWYAEAGLPRWLRWVDRFPGLAWGAALVAFWAVSTRIGIEGSSGENVTDSQYLARTALYAVIALGVVLPAVFGDQRRGLVRRMLANRVLLWVGLVSYSLFLYNVFVLTRIDRLDIGLDPWLATAIGLVLCIAVAAASYYVVERPFMALKNRVGPRAEPARDEAIAEPAPVAPPQVSS